MTLSEAYIFKMGGGISQSDADAALEFAGLNPTDVFSDSNRCAFYAALINNIGQQDVGIISESEGGYSKTYDKGGKSAYLFSLANESGCQDLIDLYSMQPKVQDKSNLW